TGSRQHRPSARLAPSRGARSARPGDALELVMERLPAGLDDPGLAGAFAPVRSPDAVGDVLGAQQAEAALDELLAESIGGPRRVGPTGTDGLDADSALRELRRDRADEADDRVLRQSVDRVVRDRSEACKRRGDDDRAPFRHDPVEAANAVDDAVDVDPDRAAV